MEGKKNLRVGLDIDGVFYDWWSQARKLLWRYYRIEAPAPEQCTEWDSLESAVKLASPEAWDWLWKYRAFEMFYHGEWYPGAERAALDIGRIAEIVVITHVPPGPAAIGRTHWLLDNDFPFSELHITTHPKHLIKPECHMYVDDGPHNIYDLINQTNATVVVWDQPWNRRIVTTSSHWQPNLHRMSEWDDLVGMVDRLAQNLREDSDVD